MFFVFLMIFTFFFWDLVHLILGLLFVRFNGTHRIGLRMLSMSLLFPGKMIPPRCRLNCESADCRNWTCSDYHRYPNK